MPTVALLIASPIVSGGLLSSWLAKHNCQLEDIDIIWYTAQPAQAKGTYKTIYTLADKEGWHTSNTVLPLLELLAAGGSLCAEEPFSGQSPHAEALGRQLVLAGLDNPQRCDSTSASTVAVKASKPQWEKGAKASLKLRPRATVSAQPAQTTVWKLDAAGDGDDDIIDDDDLLTEEDLKRPSAAAAAEACFGSGGKKACKNCTCGRADGAIVETVKLTPDMLDNPTSACGSCGLGDAFRCATCPYRGLPTFEMGKKIELPADFLVTDA